MRKFRILIMLLESQKIFKELCSHCHPSAYVIRKWEVEDENLVLGGQCWNKFETVGVLILMEEV